MTATEIFGTRRSVRSFADEEVPDDIIMEALEVANMAPSAGNLQARDFIVVKDPDTRQRFFELAHGQRSLIMAPVVLVCCANLQRIVDYGPRGRDLYCLQDVAASVENMQLYLADQGYGSCWIGAFDEAGVAELLALPGHVRPVTMLPIGRPEKGGTSPPRLDLKALVHWEKW